LQPALAFVWDMLFFSRPTEGREVVGVLLILSAIYVGTYRR
jgi:drug/metabolite transporter (DMT)-like permease